MRTKQALAALIVTSALALTACSSDSGSDSGATDGPVVTDDMGVTVEGAAGEKPTLTIPDKDPSDKVEIQVLTEGDGDKVGADDMVVANYLGQTWVPRAADGAAADPTGSPSADATAEGDLKPYVFDNSFDSGAPRAFSLNRVIAGWKEGLAGQKIGSRVLLSVPPAEGYGEQQGHDLQNDTLVFVVDIVDTIDPKGTASGEAVADLPDGLPKIESSDGAAPTLDLAGATPPAASDSTLVITGDGDKLGDNIVINLLQASYPDGADAVSTWDEGQEPITLTPDQLVGVPGLAEALKDQAVGSRIVTRISAADNAAQDGTDGPALVLVLDVIGTF